MSLLKASCLMLLTAENQIVLQKRSHSPGTFFPGLWGPIGGAAEAGESARACMLRECFEETGWVPSFVQAVFVVHKHCVETVFFSRIDTVQNLRCLEGEQLQAFTFSAVQNLDISPYHREIIDRFIRIYTKCKN